MIAEILNDVNQVRWADLRGAYGPSDGSGGNAESDIAATFHTLAELHRVDEDGEGEDDWADAIESLQSHVWHQGDIFQVTSVAIGFLIRLADAHPLANAGAALARVAVLFAEACVRYAEAEKEDKRAIAAEVQKAIAAQGAILFGWRKRKKLKDHGSFLIAAAPALHAAYFTLLECGKPTAADWTALSLVGVAPAWLVTRATAVVVSGKSSTELARAAAGALRRYAKDLDKSLAGRVERILSEGGDDALNNDDARSFTVDQMREAFGPLLEGTVLFVGEDLVVARLPSGKNATARWSRSGLKKGDALSVGVSNFGIVRFAEFTDSEGVTHGRTFDRRGLPVEST